MGIEHILKEYIVKKIKIADRFAIIDRNCL